MKTLLAIFSLIIVTCACAQNPLPIVSPEDVTKNAFSLKGGALALMGFRVSEKEVSAGVFTVSLGGDITLTANRQQLAAMKGSVGRKLYIWITDVRDGKPVVTLLGNAMAWDINRKPRFSWSTSPDK